MKGIVPLLCLLFLISACLSATPPAHERQPRPPFEPRLEFVTFAEAKPGSRWVQVQLTCDCAFSVLQVPYADGWFDMDDRILHYTSTSTNDTSVGGGHRMYDVREGSELNLYWIEEEKGNRARINISDSRTGGYSEPGTVRTEFLFVPFGDVEHLTLQIETNRSDVAIQTFSGPDLPFALPTEFSRDETPYSRLELQLTEAMRLDLSPDATAYNINVSRLPVFRLETLQERATFTHNESDPIFWHHEKAQPSRVPEIQAPPGPVRIELEFRADVKPEHRIYPYVFTEPLRNG